MTTTTPEQAVIQAARDKEWAARFHEAADQMDMTAPPPDIDPVIWQAQHDAYIAQARELEGGDEDPCEGGAHCCCCGPGEPCCDCGKIMAAHSQPASEGLREAWGYEVSWTNHGTPRSEVFKGAEHRARAEERAANEQTFPAVKDARVTTLYVQPLTEPQRLGQEGEAYDIASRISVSEFPGKTFTERLENARIVLAALTPAQAEPVAFRYDKYDGEELFRSSPMKFDPEFWTETPLFAHPPAPLQDDLLVALRKIAPIRVQDGPDYAEVFFADGQKHSTQAMTMNPQDWRDLAAAVDAALPLLAEERGERS